MMVRDTVRLHKSHLNTVELVKLYVPPGLRGGWTDCRLPKVLGSLYQLSVPDLLPIVMRSSTEALFQRPQVWGSLAFDIEIPTMNQKVERQRSGVPWFTGKDKRGTRVGVSHSTQNWGPLPFWGLLKSHRPDSGRRK